MEKNAQPKCDPRERARWHDAAETVTLSLENGWPSSRLLDQIFDAFEPRHEGTQLR